MNLPYGKLVNLLKQDSLNVGSEHEMLGAALEWVSYNAPERICKLEEIIEQTVHLNNIDITQVFPPKNLHANEILEIIERKKIEKQMNGLHFRGYSEVIVVSGGDPLYDSGPK